MQLAQFKLHAELEKVHWWFSARRGIIHALLRRVVMPGQGKLVIDIGCGTGGNIGALAREYGCLGIDPSEDSIGMARELYPDMEFLSGLAPEGLGGRLAQADAITLLDVLEHVKEDTQLLRRLVEGLKPKAQVILTVPGDMSLWSGHDVAYGHFRRYEFESFPSLWAGLPVRPRLVSAFNSRLFPLIKAIRLANRLLGRTSGRDGTDLSLPSPFVNRILTAIFQGEEQPLQAVLDSSKPAYRHGASLIAVLEKI